MTAEETVAGIPADAEVLGFYAHLTVTHGALARIIRAARLRFPDLPTLVLENADKVNSYWLRLIYPEFFAMGVDHVVLGHLERRTGRLLEAVAAGVRSAGIDGVISGASGTAFHRPTTGAAAPASTACCSGLGLFFLWRTIGSSATPTRRSRRALPRPADVPRLPIQLRLLHHARSQLQALDGEVRRERGR